MENRKYLDAIFNTGTFAGQLKYWLDVLNEELVPPELPMREKGRRSGEAIDIRGAIAPETAEKLLKIAKGRDLTVFVMLTAAFKVFLSRFTRDEDILLATPPLFVEDEGEDAILYNELVLLRDRVGSEASFKEILVNTRRQTLEAYKNQEYPLELVFKKMNASFEDFLFVERIVLAMEGLHQTNGRPRKETHWQLLFRRDGEDLAVTLSVDSGLYDRDVAALWLKRYCRLVEACLQHMELPIKDLPLLEQDELTNLLEGGDDEALPRETVIHLFEAQVRAKPDRVALFDHEGRSALSFGELDLRAGKMAHLLQAKGVAPGAIAAILLPPGFDFVVAVLAVWKAGGAYLPLDPSYPAGRVTELLSDSGAMVLVSRGEHIQEIPYLPLQLMENGSAIVERTAPREQESDLDSLQIPDRSLIHYERYRPYIAQAMVKNSMILQFSRGCAFHCAYCFKIWKDKYINRSADSIFAEMKLYYDMGVRRFGFVDDLPNINVKESSKLYRMIIDNKMKVQLHYPNGIRGDILSKDYIDLMVEAGTVTMDLALETSSPRLQKLIRKHLNVDRLRDNLEYIMEKYPHVILECQILHGFPGETEAEAMDSLEFIKSLHWVHFPYMHVLKIYPNTDMAAIAMEQGVSREAILRSADLGYHELPETLPFDHQFTRRYQAEFVNQYFMLPERLKAVLPYQLKVLTEDELVQKYNSYLPVDIGCFDDVLSYAGLGRDDVPGEFLPEDYGMAPDLDKKIRAHFSIPAFKPEPLRVLLLDLSQYFSRACNMIYDVVEPPLGLLYLGTHLQREFGGQVEVKIAKSRIDFDDFDALKTLVAEFSPQVIGVRTLSFYKDFYHKTISLLRQWGVKALVVAGGPYATSSTDTMLMDGNIDLAVLGEGELTFNHLVGEVIDHKGKTPPIDVLRRIPGLAFIDPNHPIRNREILLMDQTEAQIISQTSNEHVVSAASPNDPAYVIYTSGSTGRPKGVIMEHRALAHQIGALRERFQLNETDRYIVLAAITFDVSVMHLCLPLVSGGSVLLVDDEIKKDALRLWPLLRVHGVRIVNIVPAFMKALLKNLDKGEYGFRWLLVGGEVFDSELLAGLRETFGAQKIVNIYGPTETCINATSHLCGAAEHHPIIPIGKPLPGYRILPLDRDGNLLPVFGMGELHIGGPSLARGYLNRPELTAAQFIQHPAAPDSRLYRSGDVGFVDREGEFHFCRRLDQQVKVRGFRIEPGEIEHRLRRHPEVREAVVSLRPNGGDPSLVAYIVPSGPLAVADLGGYLERQIPAYMIPAHFMELTEIPLTANGKLDTKALPEPVVQTLDDYAPPRDQLERSLVETWADVVGVDEGRIGIDTNFFELGGHSLKATILVSRLHRQQGVKLAVVDLFQHPTIRRLAQLIKQSEKNIAAAIEPVPQKEYYEASYSQNRLWVICQLEPETTAYNMTGAVTFDESLNQTALRQTVDALVQRHEAFRTCFREVDGDPVQVVSPSLVVNWDVVDLTAIPTDEEDAERRRIFREEQDTPFDLESAPLFRIKLLLCPGDKTFIIFNLHHIIFDGWSMEILQREFYAYYRSFCGGPRFSPPPLRVHYKDYAEWQNRRLRETGAVDDARGFWRNALEFAPAGLDLPFDEPDDGSSGDSSSAYRIAVPDPVAGQLKALAREHDASLFMVMLTGFYIMLSHVCRQDDIIVAVPGFSRQHEDLMDIIGFFVNTLLIRHRLDKQESFPRQLRQVSDTTMKVLEYQSLPLELICAELKMPFPDVQVFFNMSMDGAHANDSLDDPEPRHVERVQPSKFNLSLYATEYKDAVDIEVHYRARLFQPATIAKMAAMYAQILERIAEDPTKQVANYKPVSKKRKLGVSLTNRD